VTRKKVEAICPTDGVVQFSLDDVVINDEESLYIFLCPVCASSVYKRMDETVRKVLHGAGARTIDEIVSSERVVLEEDAEIWRAVLK
jgi:hypothetical protein